MEFNSEPIRLTIDASKAMWGAKYSHFVDVWVAYRYWQNKFGLDQTQQPASATVAHRPEQPLLHGSSRLLGYYREVLIT